MNLKMGLRKVTAEKSGSVSHNADKMLPFRTQAASRPELVLAYHEIYRGESEVASANAVDGQSNLMS